MHRFMPHTLQSKFLAGLVLLMADWWPFSAWP
jgi:hypothetical protein